MKTLFLFIVLFCFIQAKSQDTLVSEGKILLDKKYCNDTTKHYMQGFSYKLYKNKQTNQIILREYGYPDRIILGDEKDYKGTDIELKIKDKLK